MNTKPYTKAFIVGECVLFVFGVILSVVSGIMKHRTWNQYVNSLLEEKEDDRR